VPAPAPAPAVASPASSPAASPADDLERAADATADVAVVGAPGAAEGDAAGQRDRGAHADIDLSALGLEPGAPAYDDRLNIFGFADVGFLSDVWSRDPILFPRVTRYFLVGNLNLYLARNLTARARTLAEVRFTFLPNGSTNADGSVIDTTAQELTNFFRPAQWGGIVIERAYAEYDVTDHLTIRGGRWLTPYGIWNTDHGSPVVISAVRPYIIGEQFFPEHQTGLDLFGSYHRADFRLGYHLTVSNGRGATEAQLDQDNKLAFGGRLELETPWGLKLGGSYYRGRYTGVATTAGTPPDTYLEAAYGGDFQLDRGPLRIQAEVIARDHHHAVDPGTMGGARDGRDFGYYVLAGYRFDRLWNVMPFAYYEQERPADPGYFTLSRDVVVGLNFRPTGSMVLKVSAMYDAFDDGPGALDGERLREYLAQAAWAF
jgi:hypothetical protein